MIAKVTLWLVFTVLITLSPLISALVLLYIFPSNIPSSVTPIVSVLSSGELLLIGSAISSAAIGETLYSSKSNSDDWGLVVKILSGGGCVFVIILSCLVYASVKQIVTLGPNSQNFSQETYAILTILLFLTSLVSAASCHISIGLIDGK